MLVFAAVCFLSPRDGRGTIADISSPKHAPTGVPSPDVKWKEPAVWEFYAGVPVHDRHRDLCPNSQTRHVAIDGLYLQKQGTYMKRNCQDKKQEKLHQDPGAGPTHQGAFSMNSILNDSILNEIRSLSIALRTSETYTSLRIINSHDYKLLFVDSF